jgi:hypothetical protein
MSHKFRIVLDDKLLPVQVFFNAIPDRAFIDTLKSFESGIGAGFNDAFCEFPGEEEFDEKPLTGIGFAIKGEAVILDYKRFVSILEDVCRAYLIENPNSQAAVLNHLSNVKGRFAQLSSNVAIENEISKMM